MVFVFFMSLLMTILMSGVITSITLGSVDHFFMLWLQAFRKALLFAFPCVLLA